MGKYLTSIYIGCRPLSWEIFHLRAVLYSHKLHGNIIYPLRLPLSSFYVFRESLHGVLDNIFY